MAIHPEIVDENLHAPGYVSASDPGAVGAGFMWIDTSGGADLWIANVRNAADDGWEEVGRGAVDPLVIPHTQKGVGEFNAILNNQLFVYITGAYGQVVKISARDIVRVLKGGAASPSYTFFVSKVPATYGAGNADPTAEYVTFDGDDAGLQQIYCKVSDGTTTTGEVELIVFIDGAGGA